MEARGVDPTPIMPTVLDQTAALQQLADLWEEDAERQRRYSPGNQSADYLTKCAADVRRIIDEASPEWVPIRTVRATTGQTMDWLRKRCADLQAEGLARKSPSGRWEIALEAAVSMPRRRERPALDPSVDLDELARVLGREEARG